MAHRIDYEVVGDDMQAVIVTLDPGEKMHAEAGAMLYITDGVEMSTETRGGFLKGVKRMLSGESFFITTFTQGGAGQGKIGLAAPYPGKIIPLDLARAGTMLCQRDSYLGSAFGVDISVAFTKRLGAGFFGGEGFILQRLAGDGFVFIHAGGTIIERDLNAGETLRVDTGCLVAFQETVGYDIQFVGGIKTALFGGEGLFFARLRGPGKVFLQTLPFSRLADRVIAAGRRDVGEVRRGGSIMGDFLGGNR